MRVSMWASAQRVFLCISRSVVLSAAYDTQHMCASVHVFLSFVVLGNPRLQPLLDHHYTLSFWRAHAFDSRTRPLEILRLLIRAFNWHLRLA